MKDALGCKFGKHLEKKDNEEDQELDKLFGIKKTEQILVC
jgi:hypothetical protein